MIDSIGRLHPLLVHLPLGIWMLLGIIMLLPLARRMEMETAIRLGILVATLSAAAAATTGWLLSRSGDYDPSTVDIHQWLGIGTAVAGLAASLLPAARRILTLLTCVIMTIAGHYGGILTHGEGYLFGGNSATSEDALTVTDTLKFIGTDTTLSADSAAVVNVFRHPFRDEIRPILNSRCTNCHSATKRKGRLRLDTEAFIRQGGKNGSILKPGDPAGSTLFTHLVLPLQDEMHMPPKGKPQPSEREIRILRDWIAAGASFGPVSVAASANPIAIVDLPEAAIPAGPAAPGMLEETTAAQASVETADPLLLSAAVALNAIGLSATVEADGIALNFVNQTEITPELIKEIETHRLRISSLTLRGGPVTDAVIEGLPDMPSLRSLNLSRTDITDKAIRNLIRFRHLQRLILYETAVTDAAIADIVSLDSLASLNAWSTRLSDAGVKTLRAKKPGLQIETGQTILRKPDSTHQRNKP